MIYIYLNFICEKEQWILCSDCNEETLVVLIFFAVGETFNKDSRHVVS